MIRANTPTMSIALVLAALLSVGTPAFADEGPDELTGLTVDAPGAPGAPAEAPLSPQAADASDDTGPTPEDDETFAPAPADETFAPAPATELGADVPAPDAVAELPLLPPTFTGVGASPSPAYFNWSYAKGDPADSGGARVTVWDAEVGGNPVATCSAAAPVTYCTLRGLTLYRKYWASVERWLPSGLVSAPGARVMVQPRLVPGIPQNVTARIVGDSVEVSWAKVPDQFDAPVTGYQVTLGKKLPNGTYTSLVFGAGAAAESLSINASERTLVHGEKPVVSVTAINDAGAGRQSEFFELQEKLPLTGLQPEYSTPAGTADGFTVAMTNLDSSFEYSVSSTIGTPTLSGNTITVAGLTPGEAARVTVTASKAGHFTRSTSTSGTAGFEPWYSTFRELGATADGFILEITNHDDAFDYGLTVSGGSGGPGVATLEGDRVTVSGLKPGARATLTVRTTRAGWNPGTVYAHGAALLAATTTPALQVPTATADGFTAAILFYNSGVTYRVEQPESGTATLQHGWLKVTGLAPNRQATVRVFSANRGEAEASVSVTGTSKKRPAIAFALANPTSVPGGWSTRIEDYETLVDSGATFTVESSAGQATMLHGTVSVSGLEPSQWARATVTLTRADTETSTARAQGSALAEYSVTFDAGAGEPATSASSILHGARASAPVTPVRERHAFDGWFTDPELQNRYDFDAPVTADLTLYAGWSVSAYAVTWNENWPDAGTPTTDIVTGGTLDVLPDPSAAGWVITGWNTQADGLGLTVQPDTPLASIATDTNVTLYARWAKRTLALGVVDPSVAAGTEVRVTATANAAFGATADVSDEVVLASSAPGDTVTGATVRANAAGARTLTGTFDGVTATADLEVVVGPVASLEIVPAATTVARGGSLTFVVTGQDAGGNAVAVDPGEVTLTSDVPTDVVAGLTVTFPTASPHTITATVGAVTASVRIEVQAGASPAGGTPAGPGTGAASLPGTGAAPEAGVAVLSALLLLAGTALVIGRRRRQARS